MNDNKRFDSDYVDLVHKIGAQTVTYTQNMLPNFVRNPKKKITKKQQQQQLQL